MLLLASSSYTCSKVSDEPFVLEAEVHTPLKLLSLSSTVWLRSGHIVALDSLAKGTKEDPNVFIYSPTRNTLIRIGVKTTDFLPIALGPSSNGFFVQFTNGVTSLIKTYTSDGQLSEIIGSNKLVDQILFAPDGRIIACGASRDPEMSSFLGTVFPNAQALSQSTSSTPFFVLPTKFSKFDKTYASPRCKFAKGIISAMTQFETTIYQHSPAGKLIRTIPVPKPKGYIPPENAEFKEFSEIRKSIAVEKQHYLQDDWFWSFTHIRDIDVTDAMVVISYLAPRARESAASRQHQFLSLTGKLLAESNRLGIYLGGERCRFRTLIEHAPKYLLPGIPYHYILSTYRLRPCEQARKEKPNAQ